MSCYSSLVCVGGPCLEPSAGMTCAFLLVGIKSPDHRAEASGDGKNLCLQLGDSIESCWGAAGHALSLIDVFFSGIALALFQGCRPARKQLSMVTN